MKRIASILVAVVTMAGWSAVASATPCVSGSPNPNNKKISFTNLESLGGNQYALTFENWDVVTSSANDCGVAVQLDTTVISTVDAIEWRDTGTASVVVNLGSPWVSNAAVGAAAEGLSPSHVGEAWFGFLNTGGGVAPAGQADLRVTVTLFGGQTAGDLINSLDKTGGKKFIFNDQFNGAVVAQNVDRGLASLTANAIPGPMGQTNCKRAIAKEASKFVKGKTKALQKCEEGKVKGKHSDPCPNPMGSEGTAGRKAADKIEKAISNLHAAIGKQCGGIDQECGGDLRKEIGGSLVGRPTVCPDFENSGCTDPIGTLSCDGIAECIECVGEEAIDQAIELYYADLEPTNPVTQQALNKCQVTIGKSTSKYLLAKEKALQKCWDKRYKGLHSVACPNITANPVTEKDSLKAAQKIAKAESKKIASICKACGGEEGLCDDVVGTINPGTPSLGGSGGTGVNADFTPNDILVGSGPFTCPSVTVPPGPARAAIPCGGSILTLADLIRCFDCVTEFKVDCMDPNRIDQAFAPYPAECN